MERVAVPFTLKLHAPKSRWLLQTASLQTTRQMDQPKWRPVAARRVSADLDEKYPDYGLPPDLAREIGDGHKGGGR